MSRVSFSTGFFSLTAWFTRVPVPGDKEGMLGVAELASALALAWFRCWMRASISSLAFLVASECLCWASVGPVGAGLGL